METLSESPKMGKRGFADQLIGLAVAVIIILLVVLPLTQQAVNAVNVVGNPTLSTILGVIPTLVAVLALVTVAYAMGFGGRK
jgi:hypothetical protein